MGSLFLADSVLEDYMFLGIYPFLLRCPISWHITYCGIHLWFFLWCQLKFLLFHFLYLGPLCFLISLARGLLILSFQKQKQLLVALIFSIVFLVSILLFSSLLSFLLLTLYFGFFLLFLILSDARLGLSFSSFLR